MNTELTEEEYILHEAAMVIEDFMPDRLGEFGFDKKLLTPLGDVVGDVSASMVEYNKTHEDILCPNPENMDISRGICINHIVKALEKYEHFELCTILREIRFDACDVTALGWFWEEEY